MMTFVKSALQKGKSLLATGVTAVATVGITVTNGLVSFDTADKTAIDTGISNGIQNGWAGFTFILPYVGIAVGLGLVVGGVFVLAKRAFHSRA